MKQRRKRTRSVVIQGHHIRYKGVPRWPGDGTEEWKVPIFKGEHELLWKLHRRKRISRECLTALVEEILLFQNGVDGRMIVSLGETAKIMADKPLFNAIQEARKEGSRSHPYKPLAPRKEK